MNRQIKFRAWDECNKIMHNNFQFIKSGEYGNDWIVFISDKQKLVDKPHPLENPYFQQQLNIMQFTGLYDQNGKEIYEGDILEFDSKEWGSQTGNKFIVTWNSFGGEWDTGGGTNSECKQWKKIIGNVFENSDIGREIDPAIFEDKIAEEHE